MNGYIAMFNGKKFEVYADSLYAAKRKAIEHFKLSKSKEHLISVHLCEIQGKEVLQSTCDI